MKEKRQKKGFWRSLRDVVLVLMTALSAIGTIAGAYGGDFSPSVYKGVCLMVMSFPAWALALIISTVLDALWCRKALVISILTFIASAPALWDFSPLNVFGPSENKYRACPKFTLMSYNVCNFESQDSIYPDGTNPTVTAILKADADIVCLQEATGFFNVLPRERAKFSPAQIDSISRRYPYILRGCRTQLLLSKYPAKVLPTGYTKKRFNEIAVYRVTVEGTDITIFNVHLQSYSLKSDDKMLYRELTDLNKADYSLRENLLDVKTQLLAKIQHAAEGRELDAERLGSYISRLGGPNVIVTGDFNDVPGCYTLRRMADFDLKEVYPEVGFGPMITFNANRFYFRIDHTLYRGALRPLRMQRPTPRCSDHYPLITTFAITAGDKH